MIVHPTTGGTRRYVFETTDRDRAGEHLAAAYGTRLRAPGRSDGSPLRLSRVDTGRFVLDEVRVPNLVLDTEPVPRPVVVWITDGRVEPAAGDRYPSGTVVLSRPGVAQRARTVGLTVRSVILDPDALARTVDAPLARIGGRIRFTGHRPVNRTAAQQWRRTWRYVAETLANDDAAAQPLVVSTVARLLVGTALATFPHDGVIEPSSADRRDASYRTALRAAAYIDAHAADDITSADIAAAASVTIRAVQLAFRRHLDTTPMAYLRRVRLDHAHQQLRAADPTRTTVTDIAGRWGFGSPSRFTEHYRATYDVVPSRTLREGA